MQQGITEDDLVKHSQVVMVIKEGNKKYEKTYGTEKFKDVESAVHDIIGRHYFIAQKKSEIIHAPTPKITLNYNVEEKIGGSS